MKILTTPHMERCIGCYSCSLACARLVHRNLSWLTAGIRIKSSGGLSTGYTAITCLACNPAPCAAACPTGAFSQRKGGGVRVQKVALHPLRRMRPGLPGGRHLPGQHQRPVRLHSLRPLRGLLPP